MEIAKNFNGYFVDYVNIISESIKDVKYIKIKIFCNKNYGP